MVLLNEEGPRRPFSILVAEDAVLAALAASGIDYGRVTQQLQEEGVQKFIHSLDKLLQCIEEKQSHKA